MSAIYMRRSPTADAPTAGGWTLIDQTDALVDDAEIATATSELKQEIGLPDSMEGEERENVEADAVINRGAALARDPRVQRSVLESLVAVAISASSTRASVWSMRVQPPAVGGAASPVLGRRM